MSPNPEELFNMLTKENPETFFIGKMVLATVIGVCINSSVYVSMCPSFPRFNFS